MSEARFRAALLDPEAPTPEGLIDPEGRPAGKRFSVYRNNVAVSLTEALEVSFPVLRALVGDEFFAAMAGVFLRRHPPRSPMLMLYGADLPGFLETFPPVESLPYLPDVARLELALIQSYHAADADPVAPETLAALTPDDLLGARFTLAPALRLIRSDWPALSIWGANTSGTDLPEDAGAEDVLVTRADFDPVPHRLGPGAADLIAALAAGQRLGAAFDAAPPTLDLAATLGLLLSGQAITAIST